jgi:hypothetical protein
MDGARAHYDDGTIACDDHGLAIHRYYPWGALRVRYEEIRSLAVLPIKGWSRFQPLLWGPSDLTHWWNLDTRRQNRRTAVVIDIGARFKPTVTPLDPESFEEIVRAHLHGRQQIPLQRSV